MILFVFLITQRRRQNVSHGNTSLSSAAWQLPASVNQSWEKYTFLFFTSRWYHIDHRCLDLWIVFLPIFDPWLWLSSASLCDISRFLLLKLSILLLFLFFNFCIAHSICLVAVPRALTADKTFSWTKSHQTRVAHTLYELFSIIIIIDNQQARACDLGNSILF